MGVKWVGDRCYLSRSVRRDGRCTSEYVGANELALVLASDLMAAAESSARIRREADGRRARHEADDAALVESGRAITEAVRTVLERAGYHRHRRGSWRKRRGGGPMVEVDEDVLERAKAGDESTLPILRAALDADPAYAVRVASGGDIARVNQLASVMAYCGKDLSDRVAMERKLDLLFDELAGPHPTAIERLLAGRAVSDWLLLHLSEQREMVEQDLTLSNHYRRQVDSRHRRYLASLKALAQVRKLDLTLIQVAAEKAVVVAGSPG